LQITTTRVGDPPNPSVEVGDLLNSVAGTGDLQNPTEDHQPDKISGIQPARTTNEQVTEEATDTRPANTTDTTC
jgi:hypothetical protein